MKRLLLLLAVATVALTGCPDEPALKWSPPGLSSPETITVPTSGGTWSRNSSTDCILDLPSSAVTAPVVLDGCNDVTLIGGEIAIGGTPASGTYKLGLQLTDWTGTAHVEGLRVRGSGVTTGIITSSTGGSSIAQLENIRLDEVHGTYSEPITNPNTQCPAIGSGALPHPDSFQTWTGPHELRVDRATVKTTYIGWQLQHRDVGGNDMDTLRMRDVETELINGACGAYFVYNAASQLDNPDTIDLTRVVADDNGRGTPTFVPAQPGNWWSDASTVSALQDLVPATKAGTAYESPGYE